MKESRGGGGGSCVALVSIEISGIALFKAVWLFLWCVCAALSSERKLIDERTWSRVTLFLVVPSFRPERPEVRRLVANIQNRLDSGISNAKWGFHDNQSRILVSRIKRIKRLSSSRGPVP